MQEADIINEVKAISANTVNEHGLNQNEERFCRHVAKDVPIAEAFIRAYGIEGKINESHYQMAMQLMERERIKDRLATLEADAVQSIIFNDTAIRKHVLVGLVTESRNKKASSNARIQALVWLGKIDTVGMFRERTDAVITDNRKPEEIEAELKERLVKMLNKR